MDDLAVLFPQPVLVDTSLVQVEVREITAGQLREALAALAPALAVAENLAGLAAEDVAEVQKSLADLLAAAPEAMRKFVALTTTATAEQADALPASEYLVLATTVIVVNRSFFAWRAWPAIQGTLELLARMIPTAGQTSPTA